MATSLMDFMLPDLRSGNIRSRPPTGPIPGELAPAPFASPAAPAMPATPASWPGGGGMKAGPAAITLDALLMGDNPFQQMLYDLFRGQQGGFRALNPKAMPEAAGLTGGGLAYGYIDPSWLSGPVAPPRPRSFSDVITEVVTKKKKGSGGDMGIRQNLLGGTGPRREAPDRRPREI